MPETLSYPQVLAACQARVLVTDARGHVVHVNPALAKSLAAARFRDGASVLRQPPADWPGLALADCLDLPSDQLPDFDAGESWWLRLPLVDGTLEAVANPLDDAAGWVLSWRNRPGTRAAETAAGLEWAVDGLAACDLRPPDEAGRAALSSRLRDRLEAGLSNMAEAIRQNRRAADTISATTTDISRYNQDLEVRTDEQAKAIEVTSVNMEELSGNVRTTADNARDAAASADHANRLAEAGREAVLEVVESMNAIDEGAAKVQGIIDVINQIAFQTNILALNAAVEAARAGEHGRGFSVVAEEVRNLARKSADASGEIRTLIEGSLEVNRRGYEQAERAQSRILEVVEGVRTASRRIDDISNATREQSLGIEHANEAVTRIDGITQRNRQLVAELAERIRDLETQEAFLQAATAVFRLPDGEFTHPRHAELATVARDAARQVGEILTQGLQAGQVTEVGLFEVDYHPIEGTDPQKYHTDFDAFTDEAFTPLQEQLLEADPGLIYAIAADFNGYVPTHNRRFSQPLTGDRDKDFVGNRTKRIFDDPVGAQVGRHEEPYKLQTYRRDTGELMFDLSVPVYVDGRHWGGFRIGYRIE